MRKEEKEVTCWLKCIKVQEDILATMDKQINVPYSAFYEMNMLLRYFKLRFYDENKKQDIFRVGSIKKSDSR